MALNEKYDAVTFPKTHYVYIEKIGPFQKTAQQAWQEVLQLVPILVAENQIGGGLSLYKVEDQLYCAGFKLANEPKGLPEGLKYMLFEGGDYIRFVLNGPYSQLPSACGRVFDIVESNAIKTSDNFCIENYVTDPQTTPEDQLVTEILVPVG